MKPHFVFIRAYDYSAGYHLEGYAVRVCDSDTYKLQPAPFPIRVTRIEVHNGCTLEGLWALDKGEQLILYLDDILESEVA